MTERLNTTVGVRNAKAPFTSGCDGNNRVDKKSKQSGTGTVRTVPSMDLFPSRNGEERRR
jgi:hypothetical protein